MKKRTRVIFNSPNKMVSWLMSNENKQLHDSYGRVWSYSKYEFYFKDIGINSEFVKELRCLHLWNEIFYTYE